MGNPIRILTAIVVLVAVGIGVYYFLLKGGPGGDPDAMTINFTSNSYDVITGLEYSPAGAGTFTAVALADGKLNPGLSVQTTIPGGKTQCRYDLKFTTEDGTVAERNDTDLCAATYYIFEPAE